MMATLVTYFSAEGTTAKVAKAFATSGGSGIGKTAEKLAPFVNGAVSVDAKLIHSADDIE